jgi:hypothetical protein
MIPSLVRRARSPQTLVRTAGCFPDCLLHPSFSVFCCRHVGMPLLRAGFGTGAVAASSPCDDWAGESAACFFCLLAGPIKGVGSYRRSAVPPQSRVHKYSPLFYVCGAVGAGAGGRSPSTPHVGPRPTVPGSVGSSSAAAVVHASAGPASTPAKAAPAAVATSVPRHQVCLIDRMFFVVFTLAVILISHPAEASLLWRGSRGMFPPRLLDCRAMPALLFAGLPRCPKQRGEVRLKARACLRCETKCPDQACGSRHQSGRRQDAC